MDEYLEELGFKHGARFGAKVPHFDVSENSENYSNSPEFTRNMFWLFFITITIGTMINFNDITKKCYL